MVSQNQGAGWHAIDRRTFLRVLGWGEGQPARLRVVRLRRRWGGPKGRRNLLDTWRRGRLLHSIGRYRQGFRAGLPEHRIVIVETQCRRCKQEFNKVLLARIPAGHPPDAMVLWTFPAALAARSSLLPLDALMQHAMRRWRTCTLQAFDHDGIVHRGG
jgi:hypothetical protein